MSHSGCDGKKLGSDGNLNFIQKKAKGIAAAGDTLSTTAFDGPRFKTRLPGSCSAPASSSGSQAYGEAWYWNNCYAHDSSIFDWYQKYLSLAPLIRLYVPRRHPILIIGCGNSDFASNSCHVAAYSCKNER